jgi:hypothetical protein
MLRRPSGVFINIPSIVLIATILTGGMARAQSTQRLDENGNTQLLAITNSDCVATDDLGRALPTFSETGGPKKNRWVGLFYWQWHDKLRRTADYDMTDFLKKHPFFGDFNAHPVGGPDYPEMYWGRPIFGYYRSIDKWVIRKHLVMFADAGVDFLYLDYTNDAVYDVALRSLLEVARDLKAHGVNVPKIVFFLNSDPEWKAEQLYTHYYKSGKNDDMWFYFKGKPLILSPTPATATPKNGHPMKDPTVLPELRKYFTWKETWAFFSEKEDPHKWRFMDPHPSRIALGDDGKPEEIVVSKSLGGPIWDALRDGGVSQSDGYKPLYNSEWCTPEMGQGLFFKQQFDKALRNPAPILLVTGWNEWTAACWETPGVRMLDHTTTNGQGHIVDEFNMNFNRDLEPMTGGYGDNYYWQFISYLRKYKGMEKPQEASAPKTIHFSRGFADWAGVKPVFLDAVGDTAVRDCDSTIDDNHYKNDSARNDIAQAQVARDAENFYFHVKTANTLSPASDKDWMMLLIDSDAQVKTGWYGYDLLINRYRNGNTCTVEKNVGGKWVWKRVADVPIKVGKDEIEISIPRTLLHPKGCKDGIRFDFKWADNIPDTPSIMDFYTCGDVAPDSRFNFRYETIVK